jgi:hypothetical protein
LQAVEEGQANANRKRKPLGVYPMKDDHKPKKRRRPRLSTGQAIPTDRASDAADLDDAEISEALLGSKWVQEPTPRPAWVTPLRWLGLLVCVIVFPLGLCVLCSWLMCRFPPSSVRHRLRGIRVIGKVVASTESFADDLDTPAYQASVEYTFKGVPYTTSDGPRRYRWPWRPGEPVLIYHIHADFAPGRYVPPGVLVHYAIVLLVANVVVFAVGLWWAMVLWGALTGRAALTP